MKKRLSVAFLWHMHQPLYKDLVTGKYHLPWVRLHATYSYIDMISVLAEFPKIKCTFNLTPSLLYQIKDFAESDEIDDVYLKLSLKKASDLSPDEKIFILRNFFSCNPSTQVAPIKGYQKLFAKRGDVLDANVLKEKAGHFSDAEITDLQVYFNLAWCGFTLKTRDPLIKSLLLKGRGYSDEDKRNMISKQKEVISTILPLYKKAQKEGRIEISTTPYYHPILPLVAEKSSRDDARWHVRRAAEFYKSVFGRKPKGMWPAEGGVSGDIIPLLIDEGVKWIATDEAILHKTCEGKGAERDDLVFRSFSVPGPGWKKISMLFRDVNISNDISFKYANMTGKEAANDLYRNILGIKNATDRDQGEHVVSIILDGENPWPYYPNGGKDFLEETYRLLSECKETRTVTMGGCLEKCRHKDKIRDIASGSWIDGNFRKWIGSPEKNRAWEYLEKVRAELFAMGEPKPEAMEEIYIAQSSDWFWWYDEFGTELNHVFDDLFRMHLMNVYRIMGRDVPVFLKEPIYGRKAPAMSDIDILMTPPEIDGLLTYGMEWGSAREVRWNELCMAMARPGALIEKVAYGLDRENIYLMVAPGASVGADDLAAISLEVNFASPIRITIEIPLKKNRKGKIIARDIGDEKTKEIYFMTFAFGAIMEAKIPFSELGSEKRDELNFRINVKKGEETAETWPSVGFFKVIVP